MMISTAASVMSEHRDGDAVLLDLFKIRCWRAIASFSRRVYRISRISMRSRSGGGMDGDVGRRDNMTFDRS